jgi:branched-chain amino acid transport system substrate-binding protein
VRASGSAQGSASAPEPPIGGHRPEGADAHHSTVMTKNSEIDMRNARNHVGARRHTTKAAIAATALLVLSVTACAGSSDSSSGSSGAGKAPSKDKAAELLGPVKKATGSAIKFGFIGDGATDAFDNTSEFTAAKATADYWNEHKGGIDGHKVEIITCATKGDSAGGTDCANQMAREKVVAVALSQSSVADSVWPVVHKAGIPMLLLAASGEDILKDGENTYNLNNGLGTLFAVPVSVAKESKIKKVTFVIIDVPQALEPFNSTAPKVLKDAGIEYDLVKVAPGTSDMTTQMQPVSNGDSGLVHVVGNDSFCIAAFNALKDTGYKGKVTSITQCITDATRKQAPPEILDGMTITALTTVGDDSDESFQLYKAIMDKYSDMKDLNNPTPMQAYTTTASLFTSLDGISGTIDAKTANAAIKAMKEAEIPGAGGMKFKCDGTANPQYKSVCSSQTLQATLDSKGNPKSYSVGEPLGG